MKPTTQSAILGAVLSAAVIVIAGQFIPAQAQAQAPAQAIPRPQQYKLLGITQTQVPNDQFANEATLNSLAADGWRVWTAVGNVVILAK